MGYPIFSREIITLRDELSANQMEFEEMFNTEHDCIDYLIAIRWPHGFECPLCEFDLGKRARDDLNVLTAILRQR